MHGTTVEHAVRDTVNLLCMYPVHVRLALYTDFYIKLNINIQGVHKVFPWLQTFITRKLRGMQTYFFSKCNSTQEVFFYNTLVHFNMCSWCWFVSFLVINVCNQGKTLCWPCIRTKYSAPNSQTCSDITNIALVIYPEGLHVELNVNPPG